MQDIKSTTEKNAPASRAISMAMQIWRYRAEHITQYGRSRRATQMPLDAAIRRVFAPYRPGGRHGHWFWCKKMSCGDVKSLFEASAKNARNGPSTQLIKAASCVESSNVTKKAEERH